MKGHHENLRGGKMILYIIGIALATIGIIIFNPLVTLIGLGISLTIFLPREDNNAKGE